MQPRWAGAGRAQDGPQELRGAHCWWTRLADPASPGGAGLPTSRKKAAFLCTLSPA